MPLKNAVLEQNRFLEKIQTKFDESQKQFSAISEFRDDMLNRVIILEQCGNNFTQEKTEIMKGIEDRKLDTNACLKDLINELDTRLNKKIEGVSNNYEKMKKNVNSVITRTIDQTEFASVKKKVDTIKETYANKDYVSNLINELRNDFKDFDSQKKELEEKLEDFKMEKFKFYKKQEKSDQKNENKTMNHYLKKNLSVRKSYNSCSRASKPKLMITDFDEEDENANNTAFQKTPKNSKQFNTHQHQQQKPLNKRDNLELMLLKRSKIENLAKSKTHGYFMQDED